MSQRGGGFRGKYKGRGRHSPYSRGGGGGGGGHQYRKAQKNDGPIKPELSAGAGGHGAEATQLLPSVKEELHTPGRMNEHGPTPGHAYTTPTSSSAAASGHTPSSAAAPGHTPSSAGPGEAAGKEKKYSVKARLFVGNLPKDSSQDMVRAMF